MKPPPEGCCTTDGLYKYCTLAVSNYSNYSNLAKKDNVNLHLHMHCRATFLSPCLHSGLSSCMNIFTHVSVSESQTCHVLGLFLWALVGGNQQMLRTPDPFVKIVCVFGWQGSVRQAGTCACPRWCQTLWMYPLGSCWWGWSPTLSPTTCLCALWTAAFYRMTAATMPCWVRQQHSTVFVIPTFNQHRSFKVYANMCDNVDVFLLWIAVEDCNQKCCAYFSRVLGELCGLWRERFSLFHRLCQPH